MTDLATLGLAVDSRPVADASKDLDRITQAAGKAERAADSFGGRADAAAKRAAAANDNLARSGQRVDGIYAKLTRTVMAFGGALLGAFSVRAITQMVDTWSDLNARVGLAIRDMDGAGPVMDRLATVARRTYSALGLTAESFVANSTALRELGYTTAQQLDYVESLNLALVVSGARAERAASVQNSLSRAMALGVLRGQELNNVIMNGGRVAELLAEEMGVGVNQLRALGTQGRITGEVINRALTRNLERLREEAELMPATIGDGFTLIGNAIMQYIGNMDQATGASETFAAGLIVVADNIDRIITTAATAVTMYGTYYVAAFVAANLATMTLVGALNLLRAALIRTGIGAVVVILGEFVYQLIEARRHTESWGDAFADVFDRGKAVLTAFGYGFEVMVANLQATWARFLIFIVENFESSFGGILRRFGVGIEQVQGIVAGLRNDLELAESAAKTSSNLAGYAWNHAFRPREESVTLPGGGGGGSPAPTVDADALAKAAREAERLAKAYEGIVDNAQDFIRAQELEASVIGMSEQAANALRYEFDLLNEARRAGISLTEADKAGFKAMAEAMAGAEAATKALKEAWDFTRDTVKGFVSDLRQGLKQGQSFFEAFANAANNALDKIIDKLLNNLLDAIFQVGGAFGGMGGGGGILGMIGSLLGFAKGGYTGDGAASQVAGVVHGGEYVMSKPAVDRLGVGYLDALHNAAKGYKQGGYVGYQAGGYVPRVHAAANDGPQRIEVDVRAYVDENGNWRAEVEKVSRPIATQAATAVARAVPSMVDARTQEREIRRIRPRSPA